jgi:hypothetical protein
MTNLKLANGDKLCRVIEEITELEWRKFEPRPVDIVLKSGELYHEDHSKFPPFTSFRFKTENPEFIAQLKSAVEEYKGQVAWHMFGHQRLTLAGTNWVVRPVFVDQLMDEMIEAKFQRVE